MWPFSRSKPAPTQAAPTQPSQLGIALAKARMANDAAPQEVIIQPPVLPAGVVPNGQDAPVAMDEYAYTYAGQYYQGQGFQGYPYLASLSTRSEFRAMAQALSTELTREWIRINTSDDEGDDVQERIAQLEKELIRIDLKGTIQTAASHDALFGRGQVFIELRGHDRNTPLVLSPATVGKGSLVRLAAVEAMWTTPAAYNALDPAAPDFYRPTSWFMLGKQVHSSRLLTIITRPVADMLKPAFNFGGISLSQLAEPYVDNWLRTRQSVSDLVANFSTTVLSTSMDQVISGVSDGGDLLKRAQLFTTIKSNMKMMLLDKEREELSQVNTPLSGLHELQSQAQEQMCAVSRMPSIILTGISPSGLNASSEGELVAWYDWIAANQEAFYRKPIDTIIKVAMLSLWGEIDERISFEFCPLKQMSAKEEADIRAQDATTAATYIDRGVLDPMEERERLARDRMSVYKGIDIEAIPDMPDDDPEGGQPATEGNPFAEDADKWITVHPNGPDSTGQPALIGENGEVKGGMGGKFNGKNIKDAHGTKNFTSHETNAETEARHNAESGTKLKAAKLKEGHVAITKPLKVQKSEFGGYRVDGMPENTSVDAKHVTVKNGMAIGLHPKIAEELGASFEGAPQPKPEKTIAAEKQKSEEQLAQKQKHEEHLQHLANIRNAQKPAEKLLHSLPIEEQKKVLPELNKHVAEIGGSYEDQGKEALKFMENYMTSKQKPATTKAESGAQSPSEKAKVRGAKSLETMRNMIKTQSENMTQFKKISDDAIKTLSKYISNGTGDRIAAYLKDFDARDYFKLKDIDSLQSGGIIVPIDENRYRYRFSSAGADLFYYGNMKKNGKDQGESTSQA